MKFHSDLMCEWDSPCGHLLCYGRFNMRIFVQAIFHFLKNNNYYNYSISNNEIITNTVY